MLPIFNQKFYLLDYCQPFEALAKNCKNTTPVWTNFKNSFAWLMSVKKLIFYFNNFFGSWHFLIFFPDLMDQKMAGAKRAVKIKKSVFSHLSTKRRNFWNLFTLVLYFYSFWPELQMAAITPGDKFFDWKFVSIVFTTCRIGISGLILNLRAMGLTYCILSLWTEE